jgi:regulator of replication initiation timing
VANENKSEKAGDNAPATPSTVEGTQNANQAGSVNQDDVNASLAAKDAEIDALKAEHQEFKDKLKPEIEKITEENKSLKAENAKLKTALDKATAKSKAKKGDPKFIVINAFRGTKEGEGIFELESDVSHLDADRLESLIERGLVKKV